MTVELSIIPCLSDNYAYLLHDTVSATTTLIDVPEAKPVLDALQAAQYLLDTILLTHHHDDHIAGVAEVVAATGAKVIGAAADRHRLPPLDQAVTPALSFTLGAAEIEVEVIDVPGHTVGHVAYYLPAQGLLFTGDSLMAWGCGRLFEGTPEQMFDSLSRLAALPDEVLVCSGHEYTLSNGRFALSLEPENADLLARMADTQDSRDNGDPTVPSSLGLEKATNPFLRSTSVKLRKTLGLDASATNLAVFAAARAAKDRF